jgi:uridine monophosphate synthetase
VNFYDHLAQTAARNNSLLCVGLDPRPEQFPADVLAEEDPIYAFNRRIVDATRDLVCAYKPNYAFYEVQGVQGLSALRRTIDYIGPEIPVILDAKRGDIGSTAAAYARAAFEVWGAGAVTVHPYLGGDSVVPFVEYTDRGIFVLCHTSNPGASELQTLISDGEPLYVRVARLAQGWNPSGHIGLVVGATYPDALRVIRSLAPQAWFLVPGIGAQGGDVDAAVDAALRADGLGLVVNVSRGVCHAPDPGAAALRFRDRINAARRVQAAADGHRIQMDPVLEQIILDLADIGAVRFGEFTLHSGVTSPIYIDLRLLASHPRALSQVAASYAALLHGRLRAAPLNYDCIAAIPYAALPIGTAVALQTGEPLVYPRKEAKSYGTKRAIEGVFEAGQRAVVLDDLITKGGSKIEAIAPLIAAGLQVKDVVVFIDRESGGKEMLAERGYRLHAVLTLRQILDVLADRKKISSAQRAQVLDWLKGV